MLMEPFGSLVFGMNQYGSNADYIGRRDDPAQGIEQQSGSQTLACQVWSTARRAIRRTGTILAGVKLRT
jgi:hypothetical protein